MFTYHPINDAIGGPAYRFTRTTWDDRVIRLAIASRVIYKDGYLGWKQ